MHLSIFRGSLFRHIRGSMRPHAAHHDGLRTGPRGPEPHDEEEDGESIEDQVDREIRDQHVVALHETSLSLETVAEDEKQDGKEGDGQEGPTDVHLVLYFVIVFGASAGLAVLEQFVPRVDGGKLLFRDLLEDDLAELLLSLQILPPEGIIIIRPVEADRGDFVPEDERFPLTLLTNMEIRVALLEVEVPLLIVAGLAMHPPPELGPMPADVDIRPMLLREKASQINSSAHRGLYSGSSCTPIMKSSNI